MLKKIYRAIASWTTESEYQQKKIRLLLKDVEKFLNFIEKKFDFSNEFAFNEIYMWLEKNSGDECIEYIVSMMMEPYDQIVNPLIKYNELRGRKIL